MKENEKRENNINHQQLIQTLRDAKREIEELRRANEILGAKVEVMEGFMQVFRTSPPQWSQTMALDVVYEIAKRIVEVKGDLNPVEDDE